MLTVTQYVVFWAILFTVLGMVWYNFDRRWGVKVYRRWYGLTHKDPLPAGEERGFIYKRSTSAKVTAATVVSTIQSILAVWNSEVNPLVELIMWVAEVPVTLLGFYAGPFAYALWQKKEAVFETIDKVESGEVSIAAEAGELAHRFGEGVKDAAVDHILDPIRDKLGDIASIIPGIGDDDSDLEESKTTVVEIDERSQRQKELEETDPRELMARFKNRGRKANESKEAKPSS